MKAARIKELIGTVSEPFNEDKITAKELLLFLKKERNLSEKEYERFCLRYAGRDITTVILYLKKYSDNKITPAVAEYLRREIKEEALRIRQRRMAKRAKEDVECDEETAESVAYV